MQKLKVWWPVSAIHNGNRTTQQQIEKENRKNKTQPLKKNSTANQQARHRQITQQQITKHYNNQCFGK